jgi:hypothetical protein
MTPPPTGDGVAADLEQTSHLWLDGATDARKKPNNTKANNKQKSPRVPAPPVPTAVMADQPGSGPYGLAGPLQMPWTLLYPAVDRVWKNDAETAAQALHQWPSEINLGKTLYPIDLSNSANVNT